MKSGDIIYCIKDYKLSNSNQEIVKNCIYKISKMDKIATSSNHFGFIKTECVVLTNNNNSNKWFFTLDKLDNYFYFYDYFISLKEQRKLKLEKINESR